MSVFMCIYVLISFSTQDCIQYVYNTEVRGHAFRAMNRR